jgi:hypothetical protein
VSIATASSPFIICSHVRLVTSDLLHIADQYGLIGARYVYAAVDQAGYSTLSWDRLGTGQSSHGDPINEIQASLEVAALYALTEKLRAGTM